MSTQATAGATHRHNHNHHHHHHHHHPHGSHHLAQHHAQHLMHAQNHTPHHAPHQGHHPASGRASHSRPFTSPFFSQPLFALSDLFPAADLSIGEFPSSDGVKPYYQSPPVPPPHGYRTQSGRTCGPTSFTTSRVRLDDTSASFMARSTTTDLDDFAVAAAAAGGGGIDGSRLGKRRRSGEPNWSNFYRNGLPKEVIVIDDTPEPQAKTICNGNGQVTQANGYASSVTAAAAAVAAPYDMTMPHQPAKRRRRDGVAPDYHIQYTGSHTNTPLPGSMSIGAATLSNDRTNSIQNTTAPTSLSSSSLYELDHDVLTRRRTRQQLAIERKRKGLDAFEGPPPGLKPPVRPPKKVPDVHVRVVHDPYPHLKVDDDDGHFIVAPDALLTDRYQIGRLLGQGTFGKVVQARDRKRGQAVAIKIIRSVQKYRDASRIELRVLSTLKARDAKNKNRCIHLTDCFDYRGHICIVMDLFGQSIYDFLKDNSFVPFPNSQIQSFARQLFTSVAFLHDLNLIHTDLKPENILLVDDSFQPFTYNRRTPSSSASGGRFAAERKVLLQTEIRLIDFGSATFQDEYHSSVVSTRHYRAPEIILGLGWSFPCDIWSIGCILVEFFTGDALFQTHDNVEHLAMMEAVVGSRIDARLVQAVNKMASRSSGNSASKYFKRLKLAYPGPETSKSSVKFVGNMKHLNSIIPKTTPFFAQFLDLLERIFRYDPADRITARAALDHPWFREIVQPDDGTEAAKIRPERRRSEQSSARDRIAWAM